MVPFVRGPLGSSRPVASAPPGQTRLRSLGLAVAAVLSLAHPAAAAITFRQVNAATPQTPQQTVTVTYNAAQTAGGTNVIAVGWNDSTAVVSSVTDTMGNAYVRAVGPTVFAGFATQSIYYAANIAAAGAGVNRVTVQWNVAAVYADVRIVEYAGLATASPVDVTAAATGTGTSSDSGAATTTNANDLVFGANLVSSGTTAAGTSFTSRIISNPDGDIAEDRIVTATGSYRATATMTSGSWIMQMVAFKAAGSTPAPTVTGVSPASGSTAGGTPVTISGTGFVSGATVSFGGAAATGVTFVSATSLTATTPAHAAGAVSVVVTNPDTQSGTLASGFTYTATPPPPTVSGVVPNSGPAAGGTSVTISGAAFVSGATVSFGGTAATGVTFVSSTSLTATAPAHAAGAVNVAVTNPDTQSGTLTNGFTYTVPPTVTGVAPTSGSTAGGTPVTVSGTGFVTGATVSFGGTAATGVTVVNGTSLTATTPAHAAGAVNVVVTNPGGLNGTLTNGFTYVAPPTVTGVAPASGPTAGGTAVTVSGTGFAAGATVSLGGTAATNVTIVSGTSLTATTPAHAAGVVSVVVTNSNGLSGTLAGAFTFVAPPTVTGVLPGSGATAGGTSVTVSGTGFASGAAVSFGGTAATGVTVVNGTTITASTPAHAAGAVNVVVTNADTQSGTLASGFTYTTTPPPPTVSGVVPNNGPIAGGTAVTVSGTGFAAGATVSLGGSAATGVTVGSSTSITATTPAHAAGGVNVVVTNTDTQSGTLASGFTYNGAPAPIAFRQVAAAVPQTAQQTVTVTYAAAQTAGNLNVVAVGWNDATAQVTSVTDVSGNPYTRAVGPTVLSGFASQSIYYAPNILSAGAGVNRVTVQWNVPAQFADVRILEYSGLAAASPVDVVAAATGSGTSSDSGAATTANANDLIFGANMVSSGTTGAGTSFTSRIITNPDGDIAEDRVVTATGSYRATAPMTSGSWIMQMVAFKAASTGPDTTPPTAPSGLNATSIGATQVSLAWTASTDNVGVTGYLLERCQGAACTNFAQVATPPGTTYTDPGLTPGRTYVYRVRATDAASNLSPYSGTLTVATLTSDTQPPTAPTNLVAAAFNSTRIDLNWTASTDNVGVTGYTVFRDGVQAGTPATPGFQDTGLAPASAHTYTVTASDAAGNVSPASSPASATTPAFVISAVSASGMTSSGANIQWTTDQPTSSQVEYGITTAYGSLSPLNGSLVLSHSQALTGLAASTTYHYRVRSVDGAGHLLTSGDLQFATTAGGSAGVFQNEILIQNLNLPVAIKFLPNGDLLVLQLGGRILRIHPGTWTVDPTPFLVLTNIGTTAGQQGLMDMTFDPNFATNRQYYVFYTLNSPNRDRVSRFTATADMTGTVAGSEFVVYQDPQNADAEHHGGALNFGNDGKLYVTTGEHFIPQLSQDLTSPRGKILRFNADGTVPTDNPFFDGAGPHYDAIWALGLRNPFRASFDALSNKLYVGDVGGNVSTTAIEELHVGVAGANFGWPNCEGFSCGSQPQYTNPVYAYPHNGRDAAITGGFIYRGSQFPPDYYGSYFFGDYAQNWIKRLTFDANGVVNGVFNFEPPDGTPDGPYGDIVYLLEGPDGALYYVDLGYADTTQTVGISKIRRIRFVTSNLPPNVTASANPTQGLAPLVVNFSSAGTFDPEGNPLTYQWTFGDGQTSTAANPSHTYATNGHYSARLSVSDGTNTTLSTPIDINVGGKPVPTILTPNDGILFRAGDEILYSGSAVDPEDGTLPASAYTWNIDFLHDGHVHPGLPAVGVTSGSFDIPTTGHDYESNTRYRITLTVTDSDGLQASTSVLIFPEKVNLSFSTVPAGLKITVDGIPRTAPFVVDDVIGFVHTVDAPSQTLGSTVYNFTSWSDGGAQQHSITVPNTSQSYVASFQAGQTPPPPGLVAGYRLNEGSGTTTADISGNNITGTLVNSPTWTTGHNGNALSFTGTNYVNLGNPTPLQMTGAVTLTAWIRISSNPWDDGAIIAKMGNAGWQLKTSADTGSRTAAIQLSTNGSDSIQRYSSQTLVPNTWYHVAGVFDGAAHTLSVYVNGVLDNGLLVGAVPTTMFNPAVAVQLGQRAANPGSYNFLGIIDEAHVYNRALTAQEIVNDMNNPQ